MADDDRVPAVEHERVVVHRLLCPRPAAERGVEGRQATRGGEEQRDRHLGGRGRVVVEVVQRQTRSCGDGLAQPRGDARERDHHVPQCRRVKLRVGKSATDVYLRCGVHPTHVALGGVEHGIAERVVRRVGHVYVKHATSVCRTRDAPTKNNAPRRRVAWVGADEALSGQRLMKGSSPSVNALASAMPRLIWPSAV